MEAFINQLKERLTTELNEIDPACNIVKGYDQCAVLIKKSIRELKHFMAANPFVDTIAEIYYYKHVAPFFRRQLVYFAQLYNVELTRITMDHEDFIAHLEAELKRTKCFLRKHGDFHRYYYSQKTCKDELLFTRAGFRKLLAEKDIRMHDNFCLGSQILSRILAYAQYRDFLNQELQGKDPHTIPLPIPTESKITKAQATELAVSIFASKLFYFDGRPATLVQITERLNVLFNINLNNIGGLDQRNRARKTMEAPFLDKLKSNYINRKEQLLG